MGPNLWKSLVLRDRLLFLIDQPLPETGTKFPEKESDVVITKESPEEANKFIDDPLQDLCKELRRNWTQYQAPQPQDWKRFYMECQEQLNLSGEWEGKQRFLNKRKLFLQSLEMILRIIVLCRLLWFNEKGKTYSVS